MACYHWFDLKSGPFPDIDDNRLQFAKNLGADYVINVKSMSPTNIASRIVNILGRRPDTSLECSGSDVSLNACIYVSIPVPWPQNDIMLENVIIKSISKINEGEPHTKPKPYGLEVYIICIM